MTIYFAHRYMCIFPYILLFQLSGFVSCFRVLTLVCTVNCCYQYLVELRRHKRNPESSDMLRRTDSESRVSNSCVHITITLVCLITLNFSTLYNFCSSILILRVFSHSRLVLKKIVTQFCISQNYYKHLHGYSVYVSI